MPTYAYACTECDHNFEQVQSFSEDSLTVCPECNGKLRKLFNAVGVVFKGSGFYKTDSRAEGKKSTGLPSKEGTSPASETKAAPKSETKSDSGSTSSTPAAKPAAASSSSSA